MPSYTLTEEQRAVAFAAVQVASEAAALLRCVADDDDTTIGEPQATLEDLLELRCALAPEPSADGEITPGRCCKASCAYTWGWTASDAQLGI